MTFLNLWIIFALALCALSAPTPALNGTSPQDGDQASVQTQSQSSELATPSSLTSNSVSGAQSSPVPISPSLSTSSSSPSSDLSQAPSLTPTAPSEPSVLSSSVPPSKASSSQPIQSSSQAFVSPTPSIVSQSSSSAVSSRSRTSSPAASTPTPTTGPAEISTYLFTHNVVRAAHGASPLEWSENLSSVAQTWANRCEFRHSDGEVGPYGENLAAGAGNFPVQSAVKLFVDENYDPQNPTFNHLTQVIWKSTTQLGCAVALCDGIFDSKYGQATYHVCMYNPVGNVIGQEKLNVQA